LVWRVVLHGLVFTVRRKMRAVAVALVASSALATQYATFSPYLDVYTNGADCTSTTPVLTVDGVQSGGV
jgi:hypothetical protein